MILQIVLMLYHCRRLSVIFPTREPNIPTYNLPNTGKNKDGSASGKCGLVVAFFLCLSGEFN